MLNKLNFKNTIFLFLLSISCLFSVNTQAKTPEEQAQEVINSSKDMKLFLEFYKKSGVDIEPEVLVTGLTASITPRSTFVLDEKYTGGDSVSFFSKIKQNSTGHNYRLNQYEEYDFLLLLNNKGNLTHIHFKPRTKGEVSQLVNFKYLQGVSLRDVTLSEVDLTGLESFQELSIVSSKIKILTLPQINNIKVINTYSSKIVEINNLEYLFELDILKIQSANMKSLSKLTNSSKLRYFMFYNRRSKYITTLPDFSSMPKLEFLHFLAKDTSNIKGIDELYNLKVLSTNKGLEYSKINFPKSLEYLTVGGKVNHEFPDLGNNRNLKELTIVDTNSSNMSNLNLPSNLEKLTLVYNKINKIEGMDRLENLKEINLKGNSIEKIEGLDNLKNIKFIKLDENKITKVEGLKNLSGVKGISFENNPIETLDFSEIEHLKNTKVLMWYTPFWKTATKEDKRKLDNLARKGHL